MRISTSVNITIGFLLCATLANGQDWTRFRGPDGSGISQATSVPASFELKDVNWKVALPGRGHSSPVIFKDKIFLTSESAEAGKRWVLCLHAKDGRVLWQVEKKLEPHLQHRFNSFASSSAAVDKDGVYVLWTSGKQLVAVAFRHDGKPAWRRELGTFQAQHGSAVSPIVVGDVVIVANDNEGEPSFLLGLDRKTGKEVWKRERESTRASYATAIVRRGGPYGTEVIFVSTSHGITSLDPATGKLNWETGAVFRHRCVGPSTIADGILLQTAGSGGGGKDAIAIELPKKKTGEKPKELYRLRRALPYVPGPLGVGSHFFLFGDGGVVSCLKAVNGEVIWRERVDAEFYASPILIGDKIYALSRHGELFVVAATDKFKVLGQVELGETSSATPAVAGGVLYLRTDKQLFSVGG